MASGLQANAADADVQAWHEGLREYPDLSLEPHLRRRQFRARNREIRSRVLARCGGLQILYLAENQVRQLNRESWLFMLWCMVLSAKRVPLHHVRGAAKLAGRAC